MGLIPDHLAWNGTVHTVIQFDIEFGKPINIKDSCLRNIPDVPSLYGITNVELLNGLSLAYTRHSLCGDLAAHA